MPNPQVELHIKDHGVITLELDHEKAPKSVTNFLSYVQNGHYDNTVFHRVIKNFMIQGGGFEPGMKQKPTQAPVTNEADNGLKNARYTVANFLAYVEAGHYNNTVFHRVIDGFMIQGGGFEPGMNQKPTGEQIKNEADNGLKNERGTIAMARTQAPHSATAQFFINVADNDFLNHRSPDLQGWGYCVFGKVSEGMDVVDAIRKVKTGSSGFHQDVPKEDVIIERAEVV